MLKANKANRISNCTVSQEKNCPSSVHIFNTSFFKFFPPIKNNVIYSFILHFAPSIGPRQ